MIRFSQRLQDVLASTGWPQNELARRAGVHPANVSRWLRGKEHPTRQALEKMIGILPEALAPELIAAWVYDALPPNAEQLVIIIPKDPSAKVEEVPPDEWPSELNRTTRRKFIDFSRLASKHPDVMEIVDVLHAAAMRAALPESDRPKG
jgi:transcriptional regulator with XRE-family HTH domain